jgi:anti-anti-sigma regulatory factor
MPGGGLTRHIGPFTGTATASSPHHLNPALTLRPVPPQAWLLSEVFLGLTWRWLYPGQGGGLLFVGRLSANFLHRARARVQDRAAPDPGGTASHGRIGSGFVAMRQPDAAWPRWLSHWRLAGHAWDAAVPEGICPVRWAGRRAVVALPEHMDASNAGQIREELLPVIDRGAKALIADMTATIWCDHAGADAVVRIFRRPVVSGTQLRLVVPPSTSGACSASAAWTSWSASTRPWKRPRPPARQ